MTYPQTLDWMFSQLPMYQRQGKTAFKKNLDNILALSEHLDHPEKKFKSIHIAGTNGKGSVSNMLASIFQEAGYKVGLHTSPHLKDFRERIRINGDKIPESFVTEFIHSHKAFFEKHQLSFFEMTIGMTFEYFAKEKVDIAIIETGLGGRLDSTNIISPELSIITNIGLDHTNILGENLIKIAEEKAGIIKPKTPVVIGEKNEINSFVFIDKAKKETAPITFAEEKKYPDYPSDLKGNYQKKNKQSVLAAIGILQTEGWKIKEENIILGLQKVSKNTGLEGRWQQLGVHPKIICDTGHNQEAMKYILQQLSEESFSTLHMVLGFVADKDIDSIFSILPQNAKYYFSKPNIPRALNLEDLKEKANKYNFKAKYFSSVKIALEAAEALSNKEDLIFVGGSTFTVAEIL